MKDLPDKGGKYLYKKSGMVASKGDFILFQYDKRIVAKAILVDMVKFEKLEETNQRYYGAFYFDLDSIAIFNPITEQELKNIWPNDFKGFNKVKYNLPLSEFSRLLKLLTFKQIQYYNTMI